MALEAFKAQGLEQKERKTAEDWMAEAVRELQAIKDGRENAVDQVIGEIKQAAKDIVHGFIEAAKRNIHSVQDEAAKRFNESLPFTNALADPSGALLRGLVNQLGLL